MEATVGASEIPLVGAAVTAVHDVGTGAVAAVHKTVAAGVTTAGDVVTKSVAAVQDAASTPSDLTWLWWLLGVLAVIVVIVVIVMFVRNRDSAPSGVSHGSELSYYMRSASPLL